MSDVGSAKHPHNGMLPLGPPPVAPPKDDWVPTRHRCRVVRSNVSYIPKDIV